MKKAQSEIEKRLNGKTGALPARNDAFDALVDELYTLMQNDALPEGFDPEQAAQDPALIELMQKFGAEAGIRVYVAEKRAEDAENQAMQKVGERLRARKSLPQSARGCAAPASPDYRGMDGETFRTLMQQMKKTARDGGKTRL